MPCPGYGMGGLNDLSSISDRLDDLADSRRAVRRTFIGTWRTTDYETFPTYEMAVRHQTELDDAIDNMFDASMFIGWTGFRSSWGHYMSWMSQVSRAYEDDVRTC